MNKILVSMVADALSTETRDADAAENIQSIRSCKWRSPVEKIRAKFARVLADTGDLKQAKRAVDPAKKKLPGILWSGCFSSREKPAAEKLVTHSGLLCADLDNLGDKLADVRGKLARSPHLWALFTSPTGNGLKAVFPVIADKEQHAASYFAIAKHVLELTGETIDGSCKDVARLCFVSFDPDALLNPAAVKLLPLVETAKPAPGAVVACNVPEIETRRGIAADLLGSVQWDSDTHGFCICPGQHLHTSANSPRDCEIHLDSAPTLHCFHNSCAGIIAGVNHELRSRIAKAESAAGSCKSGSAASETEESEESPKTSAATRLVQFAEGFAFFHDPQNRAFVRLGVKDHVEIWSVNAAPFRNLLAQIYYTRTRRAINRNALADAATTLAGRACFDGPEQPVFLRVAPHGENILIDLCDPQWRVVEVRPDGWQVLDKSPVAFVRTGSMRPLPIPAPMSQGSLAVLWEILNVTSAQRPLVAGALLNHFHPSGPYFVVNFIGEQGSAKSCAAKILRTLVDPNENPLRSPPREERDLLVQAANNWCVVLDNLSGLAAWLSDGLCRLSTGGGHSARQLYSDGEEFTLAVKRPVVLTGIDDVAARPDLAERSLQIELEVIPDNRRMTERELWKRFESAQPVIFSAVLNGLVCALRELPNIKMDTLPRMADAALWATAGESAFGWKQGTFISAYWQNLNDGASASLDAHPIGVAVRQLLDRVPEWNGEPSQLLKLLNESAPDALRQSQNWPKTPRGLSVCLRRLAQAFRRAGIDADFGKAKRRHIRLCKRLNSASFASSASSTDENDDDGDAKDADLPAAHHEKPTETEKEQPEALLLLILG